MRFRDYVIGLSIVLTLVIAGATYRYVSTVTSMARALHQAQKVDDTYMRRHSRDRWSPADWKTYASELEHIDLDGCPHQFQVAFQFRTYAALCADERMFRETNDVMLDTADQYAR